MFRIGQKVVCVDAKQRDFQTPKPNLVENAIYTITGIGVHPYYGNEYVTVAEADAVSKWGFFADRFRPAVERKTDISVFTKMLKLEKADA